MSHHLGPRYEGQLMSDGEAYSPFRSILLVLTHDYIITCVYGPTGSDGHEWVIPKRTLVAHHIRCRLWRRGWCTSRAPCDHPFGPQHELPSARPALHRQTSGQNSVHVGDPGWFRRGQAY